jgi:hypothetical protein
MSGSHIVDTCSSMSVSHLVVCGCFVDMQQ